MDDLISRQAAIDALGEEPMVWTDSDYEIAQRNQWKVDKLAIETLPSAQPEIIRINLNEPIKAKLTGWGKEIYYHQYDRTNQIAGRKICEPKFPKEDENGYTEFQLWRFIELYGEHMGVTLPNVIEPLDIVFDAPTIEAERETGKWIEDGYSHYKAVCDQCGEPCATYANGLPRDRFCKWCGARMNGAEQE